MGVTPTLIDNRYQTVRILGEGAMGQVWLAEDEASARQVALKVVSNKLGASEKSLLQFKQEFRLMTQLRHPNCCQVFDYGETPTGEPYFTMEVVPGRGLDELLPLDEGTFRGVFAQLLLALGYIHQLGLVHCDLKSANVRVRPDGTVKLMDYGLMDYAGRAGGPIRGTPAYMAPEVIKRSPLDQRSDLYSAGCLAYELLTGVLPFGGTQETVTAMQLLRQHVAEKPLPLENYKAGLSADLNAIVMRLLEKEPLERFQSAFEVLEALGAEVPAGIGGTLLGSPLIGRKEALGVLARAVQGLSARGGRQGGAVLVLGPSGIGKSRLLEEFRYTAQLEGVPCYSGACFEQGNPPYGPFLAVLRGVIREVTPDELAPHAAVLVKLLPELGVAPAPDMESPKNEMMRMHAAIAHLMVGLARKRPFALVLENWQWTDPLSAELMDYLLRNQGDAPMLVVATNREAPTDARALAQAPRIELAGLATDDLRRMVTSMLGSPLVGPAFLAKIAEFSEGNPFMVERLLEHLVQTGVLVNTHGRWNTDAALEHYQLPLGLQAVLTRKFDTLSDQAREVANLLAVIGHAVELPLLAELTGFEEEALFAALDQLQQSQVIQQAEDGAVSFAQDALLELLYAHMETAEKVRLHHLVARVLETHLQGEPETGPLDQVTAIAHHYLAGRGDLARSLRYAMAAGERTRQLYSMAAAERLVDAGLLLLAGQPPDAHRRARLGLMTTLGDIKRMTGRAAESKALLAPALVIAEELDVRPRGGLMTSLGKCHQILQELELAVAMLHRAAETCLAEGDARGASRARLANSRTSVFQGEPKRAIAEADEGLMLAQQSGDPTQRGVALAWLGYMLVSHAPARLDEGVEHMQAALALLRGTGDQIGLATTTQLLGNAQMILGDLASARGTFMGNRQLCFEIDAREEEAFALINLSIVDMELANFATALEWACMAQDRVRPVNARFPLGMALVLEGEARAYQGDEASARRLGSEALEMAREIKNKYLEGLVLAHQSELLAFLGRTDEARASTAALAELLAATGNVEPETRLNAVNAELLVRTGDRVA
ncbi:MAG: hypothetical protein JWM80_4043, partial [Cyanobacteria bacterium RYN_339]|nr:hypothetical protein [Cyanobacteria bacterium RYN_339]